MISSVKTFIVNALIWYAGFSWQAHQQAEHIAARLRRYRWFREG